MLLKGLLFYTAGLPVAIASPTFNVTAHADLAQHPTWERQHPCAHALLQDLFYVLGSRQGLVAHRLCTVGMLQQASERLLEKSTNLPQALRGCDPNDNHHQKAEALLGEFCARHEARLLDTDRSDQQIIGGHTTDANNEPNQPSSWALGHIAI
ncbi:Uu.00g093220.m01.CDS01 [Anthostomella pinea]|uniref:Uu.00g093220.m01.CDS01 n=1 Tax=Anthostomella pinea TaxID=933095 RepID=A0AAI8VNE1_9PEZI|nr:Uu.00g093220.m01.CDS01 [Anthostomella pinea]